MTDVKKGKKLAEGKTKIIWEVPDDKYHVLIESKDDITAGDGKRHHVIPGKGALSTTTTCKCFRLLEQHDIPTHFIEQVNETIFLASKLGMVPIEVVGRRIATGSYLQRRLEIAEGTRFTNFLDLDFHYKNDQQGDPIMRRQGNRWLLYDAHRPLSEDTLVGELTGYLFRQRCGREITPDDDKVFMARLHCAFLILEDRMTAAGIMLVDLKIEFGVAPNGKIYVGDVIDNDSWRIRIDGRKDLERSKQVYRDAPEVTPEVLAQVKEYYAWVAQATEKFVA